MLRDDLNRRDFHKLTAAALGGMVAGSAVGCGGGDAGKGTKPADKGTKPADKGAGSGTTSEKGGGDAVAVNDWTGDVHVCRGLNACKGKGMGGTNSCAGQGACATAKAHDCHTHNDCKFQGGCEESAGTNACKGKGDCAVPLNDGTWKKARAKFEAAMTKAEKKFGDAPAAAKPAAEKSDPDKGAASKGDATKTDGPKVDAPKTDPAPAEKN